MSKVASRIGGAREETLAGRLAEGPMPLPFALRCATDVAAALRELHEAGRAHGEVSPASVVLRPTGAALLPPNGLPREAKLRTDVAAFGAVLYEMLTGGKPPGGGPLAAPQERAPHAGIPGLRAAAIRLAAKCLAAPPDQAPTIQMMVTEVRLLNVLAQQSGTELTPPPRGAPAVETQRKTRPLAEWTATTEPIEKPAHAMPAENFVNGAPTKSFISSMMSRKPAPSPAPPERGAELPEKEPGSGPDGQEELDDRVATPLKKCPKCGSRQVQESHPRTKLEFFVTTVGIPICRCHRCYHRYVVILRFAFSKAMPPD